MKRNLIFIKEWIIYIVLLILFYQFIFNVHAPVGEIISDGDFKYQKLAVQDYQLIEYSGNDKKIVIPHEFNHQIVRGIEQYTFAKANRLEEIVLHQNIIYLSEDVLSLNPYVERIVVDEGMADTFIKTFSIKGKHKLFLYEQGTFEIRIDNKLVENTQTTFTYQKHLGDSFDIYVDNKRILQYIYEDDEWKKKLVHIDNTSRFAWYFMDNKKEAIQKDGHLHIENINVNHRGTYTLLMEEQPIVQFELTVINPQEESIQTGIQVISTSTNLLLLGISFPIILVFSRRKG